ncbi:MAG: metallophosphoesterase [Chloroflexi bacterium]|nr:metallophosphoesterase [Chloroflexota bacterium]
MAFSFIQLADPQFGMHAGLSGPDNPNRGLFADLGLNVPRFPKVTGFQYETERYEMAIAAANRLKPEFVVTCGDMCNDKDDPTDEYAELMRITGKLSKSIPMYWVSGNHDITNEPTQESLSRYRKLYGDDLYSFDREDSHFVVLNSTVCQEPSQVWDEWEKQVEFLTSDLMEARGKGSRHIVVFTHHPPFLTSVNEADSWLVLPRERRRVLIDLFVKYGVSHVFAGHWHRNHYSYFGDLQIVATSSVGFPLGNDPSGLRIVKVYDDRMEHEFYGFDELPGSIELE